MNKDIKIYARLDDLYDHRKGLMCKLLTDPTMETVDRLKVADELWEKHFAKAYLGRKMDNYDFPKLGITKEKYAEAYQNRSINDFVFYEQSGLLKHLISLVMSIELDYEQIANIRSITLTINLFPYQLSNSDQQVLKDSIIAMFKGRYAVNLIYADDLKAMPDYFRSFHYVFIYDFLLRDYEKFGEALVSNPIPDTVFLVPEIRAELVEYISGDPKQVLEAFACTVASHLSLRPVPVFVYDYLT